ncbi:o-succinylbenzoate synthase [Pseudactinotalea sp.]|uniref:o-succinylbenzoate synthase n=1 Tax=Pseudactinotalea sp. TaxID=1926260 RepID=UPI003B3B24C1
MTSLPRALVWSSALRSRFRGLERRDGVLVHGPAGWGEFSPFWDYSDVEAKRWWAAAREAADEGFPEPLRDRIPVNVTVPAVGPDRAAAIVRGSGGCTTAKVKVAEAGQSLAEESERLEAVRDALGPTGRIRVDANGAWDVETAFTHLRELDRAAGGLEYAEQPCPRVEDLAALRRRVDIPIAADESIRRAEDPMAVVRAEAADIVVLKVQPLGGVHAALRIAEETGLPVVVSSALESSVGIAAGVALAAALPELPYACGLATVQLFEHDVTDDPLLPIGGHLPVRRVAPSSAALAATRADDHTQRRWHGRIRAVAGSAA